MALVTNDSENDARRLTIDSLQTLWRAGNPQVLPVAGSPRCEIRLDPGADTMSIRAAYEAREPDLARLQNLTFVAEVEAGEEYAQIVVRVDGNLHGSYGLLATIADGMQMNGMNLASSTAAAIAQYREVLSQRAGLSLFAEIGLFGELLFLEHLVAVIGVDAASDSWLGPLSEEHDFVLPGIHMEVKTTSSERRSHIIGDLGQLAPVGGIPLSIVSIQLTRGTESVGRALPNLVADVRRIGERRLDLIDQRLRSAGWHPDDADLYTTTWTLRSTPRAYRVDDAFPTLTVARLAPAVPRFGLISEVSYRVDVTDLPHHSLPSPLQDFAEQEGSELP